MSEIKHNNTLAVTGNTLLLLEVMSCKKDAVEAFAQVMYADTVDPEASHELITLLTYYDSNGDPCDRGVYVYGDPLDLGNDGLRVFSLTSPGQREALAEAAAQIDAFTIFSLNSQGNFKQVLMEATGLPPIAFSTFLNQIIRNDDEAGSYQLLASLFDDDTTADGTSRSDKFDTGGGDDSITGRGGNDTVYKWKAGDLKFNGGAGSDSVIFEPASGDVPNPAEGVIANLTTGKGLNPFGGKLVLRDVENVSGTSHDDILTGNGSANFLYSGHGGADRIRGLGGDDSILVDHNFGSVSNGRQIDGGDGFDTLTIYGDTATTASLLDLTDQSKNAGAFAGGDFLGFEKFVFLTPQFNFYTLKFLGANQGEDVRGGSGADVLSGRGGNDLLAGSDGDDRLIGQSGNDGLDGGAGNDSMIGGGGADRFVFSSGYGNDRIADFELDADRIDLRGLFAITSFAQLKAAAINTADGVLIQGTATLLIEGVKETDLSAGDFIF